MVLNVLTYLEKSVDQFPDKIAFADKNNQITYNGVILQSKAIGSYLAAQLGQTRQPVVVLIDRDIASVIAFLGVVYSGNFYVPVDHQLPNHRINLILETIQPAALVLPRSLSRFVEQVGFNGPLIYFEDAVQQEIDADRLAGIRENALDTDPLYAMFTSGSTGVPKGALICHRSVINLIENFHNIFGFSDQSVFGNQAPFDFDVSVKDIYSTLRNGASMQVIPKVMFSFPGQLIEFLNEREINTVIWATSALRIVANLKALGKDIPEHLGTIMFSGEVMPNKVLNYWRGYLPAAQYVNLYGPTEITCNCTYYKVDRPFTDDETLPIGSPFPNTDILLLDEADHRVPAGETGQICVRGTSLALGYYNNPAETAKAFRQNPLNNAYPELIYYTGDLGRVNDKGELLFLSRKDSQIKHMGHRIELGEIEVAANALDFLDVACCVYDQPNEKIVMFYQAPEPCDREVLIALKEYLPKYMLPNRLVHFNNIPMNKNSKIDRVLLKKEFIDGTGA